MLLLFIPIGITVHLAEKIGKILDNNVPIEEVLVYFLNFTIYFANLLFPLFLFLSVIWFTSKLANNTEIVAFLSSGVSFSRFLSPYIYGAILASVLALILRLYLAPIASKGFNEFDYKYFKTGRSDVENSNVFRQINEKELIYVSSYDPKAKQGTNFILEHFEDNVMTHKITADIIKYYDADTSYNLVNYTKRTIGDMTDKLEIERKKDTLFAFDAEDLTPVIYIAEILPYKDL